MTPYPSWNETAGRVIIQATNYLEFDGTYSVGGRQRHIRDIALLIKEEWKRDVLIIQKGVQDFEKECPDGLHVIGIKSNLKTIGDINFSRRVNSFKEKNDRVLYASGEDAWPFFSRDSKAIQHGIWWDGPQSFVKRISQKTRAMACMRSIKSMLCVDTNFINWLRVQGPEGYSLSSKCVYIPNYADTEKLAVSSEEKNYPIRLICARRNEYKRGIHLFIEALSELDKLRFPFQAHISTPNGLDQILDQIRTLKLNDRVTASSDDMEAILSRFSEVDVAVIPTLWSEGTSLACVEAICSGVPVIATPVGGLGNIVIPGFNGFLVKPFGWSIAEAIMNFTDVELLVKMRSNCLSMRQSLGIEAWRQRTLLWLQS